MSELGSTRSVTDPPNLLPFQMDTTTYFFFAQGPISNLFHILFIFFNGHKKSL